MIWIAVLLVLAMAAGCIGWCVLVVAGLGRILRGPRQQPTEPTLIRGQREAQDLERLWRQR